MKNPSACCMSKFTQKEGHTLFWGCEMNIKDNTTIFFLTRLVYIDQVQMSLARMSPRPSQVYLEQSLEGN